MNSLFNPRIIKSIILILSVMLFVKLGWFVVELTFLSSRGVEHIQNSEIKSLYYRVRLGRESSNEAKRVVKAPVSDIRSFKLLAIISSPDITIITISKQGKNSVLSRGDTIDGYRLESATAHEAIFSRGGKHYRLELIKSAEDTKAQNSIRYAKQAPSKVAQTSENADDESKGEIVEGDDVTVVDKSLLTHYSRNMNDIWKNIGVKEVMDGKNIKGFKVNFVKRGSDFSKLGLRRGDIIKAVNGQEMTSYNSAFEIYKNINTIESLTLTIKRGEEEMELNYEIN